MGFLSIVLIGVGLAMDAFAVALAKGITFKKFNVNETVSMALTFGIFQGAMILIGRFIGGYFYSFIDKYNKIIVFLVFIILGIKMLIDCFKSNEDEEEKVQQLNFKELLALGLATSIDALAVGITFATYKGNMISPPLIIGLVTFILSVIASVLGYIMGKKIDGQWAEIIGAVILILLGIKVLF